MSRLIRIETTNGTFRVELYQENELFVDFFLELVKTGIYNGLRIHRVSLQECIQGGDFEDLSKPYIHTFQMVEVVTLCLVYNFSTIKVKRCSKQ